MEMSCPTQSEHAVVRAELHVLLTLPTQQLHLCRKLPSAKALADLIAGFAHANGGHIVVGYDPKKKRARPGFQRKQLEARVRDAETLLGHPSLPRLEFHQLDGREVGVIVVPPVDRLIPAPGGLLVREGDDLRAMEKGVILQRLNQVRQRLGVEDMGTLLFQMNVVISEANRVIKDESHWWSKFQGHALGWLIGALLGAGVTFVISYLHVLWPK
jgi:hypothetical protein